jgi:phosphatidyl-myo-inositol dimannoside synthase
MNHLFVTQDYAPDLGGMARRHVELCRHFADGDNAIEVSTVDADGAEAFDAGESYRISRQPFPFSKAKAFTNQLRWGRWIARAKHVDVIHCGNIRPCGYAVLLANRAHAVPFLLYVNGGDLLREQVGLANSARKRLTARKIFGGASGILATSAWVEGLTRDVMRDLGLRNPPPIGTLGLGTDPEFFHPSRDTGKLREKWGIGRDPLMLTVARLIPHKGQDIAIRALSLLKGEFPSLRYAIVGTGLDEPRLRTLANELGVADRVIFAGALSDAEVAEAYATATVYVGLSRVDVGINAEGFGISFLEAAASGIPIVAGDSGGVRSAVSDGENGIVVPPQEVNAAVDALRSLLSNQDRRAAMGAAGRQLVETRFNWDRVARETREFTRSVVGTQRK